MSFPQAHDMVVATFRFAPPFAACEKNAGKSNSAPQRASAGLFGALARRAWEKRWGIGEGLVAVCLGRLEAHPERCSGLRQAAGSVRFAYF